MWFVETQAGARVWFCHETCVGKGALFGMTTGLQGLPVEATGPRGGACVHCGWCGGLCGEPPQACVVHEGPCPQRVWTAPLWVGWLVRDLYVAAPGGGWWEELQSIAERAQTLGKLPDPESVVYALTGQGRPPKRR